MNIATTDNSADVTISLAVTDAREGRTWSHL